ncbi:CotH kinase family protein [Butyrivibrio sp. MC2013]|uniref:CotH kinase family protein n=1 Tax=Butyrivibrio sp. MC2013 TaxID=1280686 RepID=UPI0004074549|nr:CotH kinase family protein [Butyrivibrio sp. MC2013]
MKKMFRKDGDESNSSGKIIIAIAVLSMMMLGIFIMAVNRLQQREIANVVDSSITQNDVNKQEKSKKLAQKQIVINEIGHMSDYDYIELINSSKENVDISAYNVSLNVGDYSFSFSSGTVLSKGQYKTIRLGTKDCDITQRLKFDNTDYITVRDSQGELIDSLIVPTCNVNEAFGRTKDGEYSFGYFNPTEGSSNNDSPVSAKNKPVISLRSGMYDSEMTVQIYTPEHSKTYYTLDGTEPTTESSLYTDAITITDRSGDDNIYANEKEITMYAGYNPPADDIDKATVLKAMSVFEDGTRSDTVSETYFINYGKRSEYQGIPIIAINTDPADLFDYRTGIYVLGEEYGNALINGEVSSRSANFYNGDSCDAEITYIEKDRSVSFIEKTKLSIGIDDGIYQGQKSLQLDSIDLGGRATSGISRFLAKNEDGYSLLLSNGGKDYLTKSRNRVISSLASNTSITVAESQLCAVFLDGEYWGVYTMNNTIDSDYISQTYKVSDSYIVNNGKANSEDAQEEYRKLVDYIAHNYISKDEEYKKLCDMVDIDNFIEYYALKLYIGDANSFTEGNASMWRSASKDKDSKYGDGKWRMILGDSNASSGASDDTDWKINTFASKLVSCNDMFASLMCNDTFRDKFVKRFKEMEDDFFSSDSTGEIIDSFLSQAPIMRGFYSRFVNNNNDKYYDFVMTDIYEFFENRQTYIDDYLADFKDTYTGVYEIKVHTADKATGSVSVAESGDATNSDNGYMKVVKVRDEQFTLIAVPEQGYTFTGWTNGKGVKVIDRDENYQVVTVSSNADIKANFVKTSTLNSKKNNVSSSNKKVGEEAQNVEDVVATENEAENGN